MDTAYYVNIIWLGPYLIWIVSDKVKNKDMELLIRVLLQPYSAVKLGNNNYYFDLCSYL